jgi:GT2 family glycosyltransferase
MESRAPAVVAVVVTTGPAPGLEAALTTLVGQDYEEMSVLVVANGAHEDVVARVAAVAPSAFVKVLDENRGFASACNEAALMVKGAAFMLFSHDDVLFFEGSVRLMVEAAFRANAGIVSPKVVAYDDPFTLVHVGQIVDRFGTVRERVELGEIDHGQQDLERDVFVAPGGVTLIRTDLFETLQGFDPLITAIGEDLDLCWRAQIAGARIVVAPSAVVAHRQTMATGDRTVSAVGTRNANLRDLQRRHQLATVLTCWGVITLLQVIPLMLILDIAEMIIALVGRDVDRISAVLGSYRWAFKNRKHLRARRRDLAIIRVLDDREITRLQIGGASRLKEFFTTLARHGIDQARGILPPEVLEDDEQEISADTVGFASVFSDDLTYDEFSLIEPVDTKRRLRRVLTGARGQIGVLSAVALLWVYGARNLVSTQLPIIGRLAPLDSWWSTWRHFFASWSPNGVGTGAPAMPGYGVLAFAGTFVFGRMGVLPRAALILAVPLGAWGVWRLLRVVVSNRARVLGVLTYMAFPIGANLIQRGRIDVLVIQAALPFVLRRTFNLLNVAGFRTEPYGESVGFGARGWGTTRSGQVGILTLLVALMSAMAPVALVVELLVIGGVALGRWLTPKSEERIESPVRLAITILLGSALLLLPMSIDTILAGRRAFGLFGLTEGAWSSLSFSQLVRGANGSMGYGWTAWLIPIGALAAVALARGARREFAVKFAGILVLTLSLAVLTGRHLLGTFAPDVDALLVLVGLMMAALVACTVGAIENDLSTAAFGWHQALAALALGSIALSALPLVAQSSSGSFALPVTGTPETLASLSPSTIGGYRVLWLGDPSVLPLPGWSVAPGLAAATTTNSLPSGADLFSPPTTGAADQLLNDVASALNGRTVRLGQLLAVAGVSTIVVMTSDSPTSSSAHDQPPARLLTSLEHQSDLVVTAQSSGATVFSNSLFHGVISERSTSLTSGESTSTVDSVVGWNPIFDPNFRSGPLSKGTVMSSLSPSSAFSFRVNSKVLAPSGHLSFAATYRVTETGTGQFALKQFPLNGIIAGATLAVWALWLLGFASLDSVATVARRVSQRRRRRSKNSLTVAPLEVSAPTVPDELATEPGAMA